MIYLFLFTFFLQYIFATYLIYYDYAVLEKQMKLPEKAYFDYAITAVLSLFAGILLFNRDLDIRSSLDKIRPEVAAQTGFLLLGISLFVDAMYFLGFGWIQSIRSFTEFFKYLSFFCFLYTGNVVNYALGAVLYLFLAYRSFQEGVFMNLLIWTSYLFFFITLRFRLSLAVRALMLIAAIPLLILVQTIKPSYRKATWSGRQEGNVNLAVDIAEEEIKAGADQELQQFEGVVGTVGRLNQGWHLGMTLKRVPAAQPFANGKEMTEDIIAALIPRIFLPNKKEVNSQDKFYKYTGHRLRGNTSMSIGILGDFYINFGRNGSYIALFIYGSLVSIFFFYFLRKYVKDDPINIIWVPFILSYLVRADNDFYTVFNCIIKSFILFLFINFLRKRIWPSQTT